MASIIQTLAGFNVPLTDTLITEAYTWVQEQGQRSMLVDGVDGLLSGVKGETMVMAVTGVDVTA